MKLESNLEVLKVSTKDIPIVFNDKSKGGLSTEDVVAFVRAKFRNPWDRVVLELDATPVSPKELESANIFVKSVNDDAANRIASIDSERLYLPVNIADIELDEEGNYNIDEIINNFKNEFDVSCQVICLIVASESDKSEIEKTAALRDWSENSEHFDLRFPWFLMKNVSLLPNGVDIGVYAEKISQLRTRSTLSYKNLRAILDDIDSKIDPSISVIQDLRGKRTPDVKMLTTYLLLSKNIPPLYVSSFLSEYIDYSFNYPIGQLSLFERLMFVRRLPEGIGYIGINPKLHCIGRLQGRIYPNIQCVFDVRNRSKVTDEALISALETTYKAGTLPLIDYRSMFQNSQEHFALQAELGTKSLAVGDNDSDFQVDCNIVDMFTELSEQITEEDVEGGEIFMSVKNTVMCKFDGNVYIIYCPEECGIYLGLVSDYFPPFVLPVPESQFNRLIDLQLEMAIVKKEQQARPEAGAIALSDVWRNRRLDIALRPAIPYEVTLCTKLLPTISNGLSYYDSRLRCHKNVLPISTAMDATIGEVNPMFKELSLKTIRRDLSSKYSINCFGTVSYETVGTSDVKLTYRSFKGKGLLE